MARQGSANSLPTTPRRSQRHQPIATPSTKSNDKNILECGWSSEPIYTRKTNSELDLLPDERENQDEDDDESETVFYDAFRMKRKATVFRGTKRMQAGKTEVQTYRIGDPIMVETDALNLMKRPPSIGVIVAMWETRRMGDETEVDPSKMRVRVHWFLRPSEMARVRAKREHEENEIYYCLSSRVIVTPSVILSRCTVTKAKRPVKEESKHILLSKGTKRPRGSPLKKSIRITTPSDSESEDEEDSSTDAEKTFYCRLAVDSRRGVFYEFDWERHQSDALLRTKPPTDDSGPSSKANDPANWGEGRGWDVVEKKKGSKEQEPTVKKPRLHNKSKVGEDGDGDAEISESDSAGSDEYEMDDMSASERDEEVDDDDDDDNDDLMDNPRTPRKRKRGKTFAEPTPHSKAVLHRRKRRRGQPGQPPSSPRKRRTFAIRFPEQSLTFQASMAHLPKDPWLRSMHALHVGSRPDVLPCREAEYAHVLQKVGDLLEEGSGGCVYISGVPGTGKTATVHAVVKELKRMAQQSEINPFTYVEINGLKIPEAAAAYTLLWEGITGHDVAKEGHLRLSTKESLKALMRHFTTGNRGPGGHACVVLMDELDQLVTPKQDVVYNFFNWPTMVGSKLVVIAVANTMDLPERAMTGRVRSRMGMIRINFHPYTREQLEKIVEARLASAKEGLDDEQISQTIIAPDAIKFASMTVSRITGDARRVLDICRRAVELVHPTKGTVKPPQVKEVVQIMQNTPTAAFLRDLSFHERLMLASLVKCIKREGVEEIKWGEVQHQHLLYMNVLTSEDDPTRKPTPSELVMVLDSLVSSRAVVVEEGAAIARKPEGERRLLLNIEQGEVEKVLGDVGGQRWKNALGN